MRKFVKSKVVLVCVGVFVVAFCLGIYSRGAVASTVSRLEVLLALIDSLAQPVEVVVKDVEEVMGGLVHRTQEIFVSGLKAGKTNQFTVDSSGNVTTTGTFTGTGTLTASDGQLLLTYDAATTSSSDIIEVARLTVTHSSTDGMDGLGGGINLYVETEDTIGGVGHSTTTGEIVWGFDDTATTSLESFFQIKQKLDNAYTNTTVLEIDSGDFIFNTNDLFIDYSTSRVGIGDVTPDAFLDVEALAGSSAFMVGSSTTKFIIDSNGNVGIATSSPNVNADFAVGASATATTTIDFAKPCFSMTTTGGTGLFYWPCTGDECPAGSEGGWATSTTACY